MAKDPVAVPKKPLIYLASPYTRGDPALNTHFQCLVFDRLLTDGIITPFMPLWSHFQHMIKPRPYQDWIDYDLEVLHHCDGLIRLEARVTQLSRGVFYRQYESPGADGEVDFMKQLGKPVFTSVEDCYEYFQRKT